MKRSLISVLFLLLPLFLQAQIQPGYYRFPAIHGETIVFTAEGDLWRVSTKGGIAQRLTTHHGTESHPAISPDGTLLAFSAQYEGPTEVYIMPLQGGLPTRKTYEGERVRVIGWTPESKILYSTRHYSTLPNTQLATISPQSIEHSMIPLNQASEGVFESNGKTLFFTRLAFQGSRTKRYKGGTAQNIWKFTYNESEAVPLTVDYTGTSKEPMWWNGRIYFVSDRDGTMNLWSMNEDGKDLRQHTKHKGWDIQSPDLNQGSIVYQLGADLYLFDISTEQDQLVAINLASDFDQTREKWLKKPMNYLTDVHLSPDGDRVALTAHGRAFVAPAKQGRLVEATRKNGIRFRNALFMPDGKSILVLSDETGEFEFWRVPADGIGQAENLTNDGNVFRYEGTPSPDGKRLAYTDKDQQLWIYEFASKKPVLIAVSQSENFFNLNWSPDSQWMAYVAWADNENAQIMLYSLKNDGITILTSDRVDSYNPAWSPDGKWIYFLSDRHFQSLVRSPWGSRQPEPFYAKTTKIYMAALTKLQRSPFKPVDELFSNEEEKTEKDQNKDKSKKDKSKDAVMVKIDLAGIQKRIFELPVPPGN